MPNQSPAPKLTTKKHVARLERERQQVAIIRTVSITAIAIVVLLITYGILDQKYFRLHKSVAEVNDETISLGYFQERLQLQRANLYNTLQQYQYFQQNFGMDTAQQQQEISLQLQSGELLGQQVLNQLIDEALIRQEAKNHNITVTEAEVDERVQAVFNFYPNGTPIPTITPTEASYPTLTGDQLLLYPPTLTATPILTSTPDLTATPEFTPTSFPTFTPAPATPTPLPQLPTATSTPYTLEGYQEQFKTSLDNMKQYGVSEAAFRSVFENIIYREKLQAELTKDVPNTAEQVLARHILVGTPQEAIAIRQLVLNGSDFAKLAREKSLDTGSGAKGGELDWSTRETFVKEFADAAFSQDIGAVGEPVKTQFGYHIIQVIARAELPLSASQYEQKQQTAFTDWLTKTNDETKANGAIVTHDDIWLNNLPAMPFTLQ